MTSNYPVHNGKSVRTWVEISKKAVEHNIHLFQKIAGSSKLMAVVKSNAYGHGLVDFSRLAEKCGVDWLGVDSVVEGLRLREEGIKIPVLVLGYTIPENYHEAEKHNISLTVSSIDQLKRITKANLSNLKFHLKIDTGMHRQGVSVDEVHKVINALKSITFEGMLEGVYTHLANAKNPSFVADTKKQLEEFNTTVELVKGAGYHPICHAAATGGALIYHESRYDMVRIGIGIYGLWPSFETRRAFEKHIKLSPVLSWKTTVSETRNLTENGRVGYDFTEHVKKGTRLAVCPIGYWHGFPRVLSSVGHVLVRGKRARVVGRVSMDMIVIDVTGVPGVREGDEVILIGKQGKEHISAEEFASLSGTINYEVITRLNPLMKRIYI